MIVFDASALLAFLGRESGAQEVQRRFGPEAVCGAANWSEVAQKVSARGGDWTTVRALLLLRLKHVEPVSPADAELAAALWRAGSGLSLADRLCLALGRRLNAEVITTDRAWADLPGVTVIR